MTGICLACRCGQALAPIFNLSVSVQIVAGRDDFAERGSVSRSTLKATDALDLSKRWAAGKAPAGHRPALLWLRLRRAALYRRLPVGATGEGTRGWDCQATLLPYIWR